MIDLRRLTDILLKLTPLILTALIYWFGVVKNNERQKFEILQNQTQITILYEKIEKLEDKKADKYTIDLIMNTLNRIDTKIDKLQEQVNKK